MSDGLPKFDNPPVVETVIGVQFAPLRELSTAHIGWYWKECLDNRWTKVEQAVPLPDQFERFAEERSWVHPGIRIGLRPQSEPDRLQIIQDDDERMIQVQRTRFIYNWRKHGSTYPSYATLRPEFDSRFDRFVSFAKGTGLGEPEPNQWEMTYVNHIEKGDLWSGPEDWLKVLPGFYAPLLGVAGQRLESFGGEWHLVIEPNRGRLHVAVSHGQVDQPEGREVLVLQLTARGPIDEKRGWSLDAGLELAHETIVRSFAAMTSKAAHEVWRKKGDVHPN
jgi:uncharacterized protein (TIGR04255 family)